MLNTLQIKNFRGIHKLDLEDLAPVTVFTGSNGAGKTTILEATLAIYGRKNPVWITNLQTHRGFDVLTPKGPNYLGLFHNFRGTGKASVSAKYADRKKYRVELEVTEVESTLVASEESHSSTKELSELICRAYAGQRLEHTSRLVWKIDDVGRPSLRPVNGLAAAPSSVLMHPTDRAAGADEQKRFGELVLRGDRDSIVEALRLFEERIADVQFIRTDMGDYFVVEREGEIMPLGLLGGGINALFRFLVNIDFAKGGFAGIDEVENGFHHSLHSDAFRILFKTARRTQTQLFLTTHSGEALRALVDAAMETKDDDFAVVHLRRDKGGAVLAKVFRERDALQSLDLGYELR